MLLVWLLVRLFWLRVCCCRVELEKVRGKCEYGKHNDGGEYGNEQELILGAEWKKMGIVNEQVWACG